MKRISERNIQPGDMFYIPAMNKDGVYGFVIARYIALVPPNVGHLIEVFEKFYTSPPNSIEEINTSHRLFRPFMCDLAFSYVPRWKVLFSDQGYDRRQSDYDNIAIAFHSDLWIGGKTRPATRDQLNKFEPSICWRSHHLISRVNAYLAGLFRPDESYDPKRVPEGQRSYATPEFERVVALAIEMDRRFHAWATAAKTNGK